MEASLCLDVNCLSNHFLLTVKLFSRLFQTHFDGSLSFSDTPSVTLFIRGLIAREAQRGLVLNFPRCGGLAFSEYRLLFRPFPLNFQAFSHVVPSELCGGTCHKDQDLCDLGLGHRDMGGASASLASIDLVGHRGKVKASVRPDVDCNSLSLSQKNQVRVDSSESPSASNPITYSAQIVSPNVAKGPLPQLVACDLITEE